MFKFGIGNDLASGVSRSQIRVRITVSVGVRVQLYDVGSNSSFLNLLSFLAIKDFQMAKRCSSYNEYRCPAEEHGPRLSLKFGSPK